MPRMPCPRWRRARRRPGKAHPNRNADACESFSSPEPPLNERRLEVGAAAVFGCVRAVKDVLVGVILPYRVAGCRSWLMLIPALSLLQGMVRWSGTYRPESVNCQTVRAWKKYTFVCFFIGKGEHFTESVFCSLASKLLGRQARQLAPSPMENVTAWLG